MKLNTNYKSRFRILKGGKISLVVSALLVSVSLSTPVNALSVTTDVTTTQSDDPNFADIVVTPSGSVTITADGTDFAALHGTADIYTGQSVSNSGTISLTNTDQSTSMRGILIDGYNDGTISNLLSGTIDIDSTSTTPNRASAIEVSGNYGDITLDGGDITVTSVTNARGIFITGNHTGTITNSALLSTTVNTHPASAISNQSIGIDITGTMSNASIVNSSTINSSGDRGVASSILVAGAVTNSTITNSFNINATGTGSARAYGISLKGGTVGTTTITNDGGTIAATNQYADATGINIIGNSAGTITNSGTIDVTAGSTGKGKGIYVDGDFEGNITNSSSILVDGDTTRSLYGIEINGTLTGNVSSTFMELNSSAATTGIGVDVVAAGSTVKNSATLKSHSGSWAAGIVVGGENYGTIETRSLLDVYSESGSSYGIKIDGNYGTISSYATVKSESTDGEAFGIYVGDNNGDIVLETGSIDIKSVNAGWWTGGIMAYGGDGTGNITTKADTSITVNVSNNDYEAMGILSYDNNIINAGTISAYKDEVLDESAFSIYSPSAGDIDVENTHSGILNGNIYVKNGTLTNSGTVALPHNAYGEDWAWVDNFTNEASGTLTIGLQTNGTTITHSQLGATTATFEDGTTIKVDVTSASTNVGNIAGERLDDVVWTNNGLTVDGDINIDDNSALLDFEIIRDEDSILDLSTIDLAVVGANADAGGGGNIENTSTLGSGNIATKKAARALDTIQSVNHPAMTSVFTALNALPTNEAVAKAVESTTPQTTGAAVGAVGQISNGIAGIVEQRQNITMNAGGLNSGDEMFSNKNSWVKTFGSFGEQDNVDGLNGFDVKAYGIGMGIDAEIKDEQTLGFAFFYTNASVDVNNVSQTSDLDVFTTLVYGNAPIIDDKTKLLYQVGYAWQKTTGERDVFTGDKAKSKYTSKTASLDLKVVRDYKINDKLLLQPLVSATYRHFTNPEYSETGAGALNLNVQKFTSSELIATIGTMSYYKLDDKSKIIGNINVGYDFHDRQQSVTSAYQGASSVTFDTTGIDNGRWSYEAGIGYEKDLDDNSNINFSYNYQAQGTTFSNNTISAKYVYKF